MNTPAIENEKFSAFLNKVLAVREFPVDTHAPAADELRALLEGRVFSFTSASTGTFYMEFEGDGSFSVVTDGGFRNGGQWSCEHGILCTTTRNLGRVRSPVRVCAATDAIYLKRHTGEVVCYAPVGLRA